MTFVSHDVRLVDVSDGSALLKARAVCSCGWKGRTVRYRLTAERHAEKHKAEAGGQP